MFLEISLFYAFYFGDIEGDVSCELSGQKKLTRFIKN